MFGSHLSIAGGHFHALHKAAGYGMDCVQIFTANQQQWRPKDLTTEAVDAWAAARTATGIDAAISHGSYLVNLASPDDALWRKSIAAAEAELGRCAAMGIAWAVFHPGAHMGSGEDAGLSRVAAAIDRIHADLPDCPAGVALEITAGQGTSLGHDALHLRRILDAVDQPDRLGVCLDTAHMLAAGYDLTGEAGARKTLRQVDEAVGLERVCAVHLNDSKKPRGSRVDRHEHIGHGHVALDAFGVFVRSRRLARTPKILETPKAVAPDGRDWDEVNLETLRRLRRRNA